MFQPKLYRSKILGTGTYLPEKILSNLDLEKKVQTTDEWITERTGIKRRHIAAENQAASDLAYFACQKALENANISPQEIDLIIVGTFSGDYVMPNCACLIQHKLGCRDVGCIEISAACAGFIYCLSVADQYIKTGFCNKILVIGSEVTHYMIDYEDRDTSVLFGDGAGVIVLGRSDENETSEVLASYLHGNGSLADILIYPAGGSKKPFSKEVLQNKDHYIKMKGREVFKNAVNQMTKCCLEAIKKNNININDIDWIIPHQANIRIIEALRKNLNFPKEKVLVTIEETGNTSSATIPFTLDIGIKENKIKRGDLILMVGFGAGVTSGSVILRY